MKTGLTFRSTLVTVVIMYKVRGIFSDISRLVSAGGPVLRSLGAGGRFLVFLPSNIFKGLTFFIWPKKSRKRYRTVLFAVFLVALFAVNLDYPNYWNGFADWLNPKLDAVDMPESVRRLDRWDVLKKADEVIALPHFWNLPFSQGLDLQGGVHLIYKADLSGIARRDRSEAMNGLRDVIERRVNFFGVREPKVLVQEAAGEYRLLVELAGVTDFNKAVQLIGQTPFLEFKEERSSDEQKRLLRDYKQL